MLRLVALMWLMRSRAWRADPSGPNSWEVRRNRTEIPTPESRRAMWFPSLALGECPDGAVYDAAAVHPPRGGRCLSGGRAGRESRQDATADWEKKLKTRWTAQSGFALRRPLLALYFCGDGMEQTSS
jgi:hypothetical protein